MSIGSRGDATPGAGRERATSGLRRSGPPAPAGPALPTGTVIAGRYRISGVVGRGGMGAVYRAEQIAVKRQVALKVMEAQGAATSARFEREALAASRMKSPHVVTIHDFGQDDDGLLYLVMELLEGENLGSRLFREGSIRWREVVSIAIHVARALSVAHAADVVHRDLKPDNVFLTHDDSGGGLVKVLDFGIARLLDGAGTGPSITSTDIVVGTPLYMSPEACARKAVGPAADIYSLGAMLFEMLTGRVLWDQDEPVLIMAMHLKDRPPRVSEVRPDLEVPKALDDLIDRMLAKDPATRPRDGAAVLSALRGLVDATEPIAAPVRSAPAQHASQDATLFDGATSNVPRVAASRAPRSAAWLAVGAGAAALMLVGAALVFWPSGDSGIAATELPVVLDAPRPLEPSTSPGEPASPEPVEVRFDVTPEEARLHEGETALDERRVWLARDGAVHQFTISADGYEAQTLDIRADVDRVVSVVLTRASTRRPAGRRGSVTKTPPRPAPMMREW